MAQPGHPDADLRHRSAWLNILVGVTGQVSLGHAFFMGTGAYTAVMLGGNVGDQESWKACVPFHDNMGLLDAQGECGLGLPIWIWLPVSGLWPRPSVSWCRRRL